MWLDKKVTKLSKDYLFKCNLICNKSYEINVNYSFTKGHVYGTISASKFCKLIVSRCLRANGN